MSVELSKLEELLNNAFPCGSVSIRPLAADNDHYSVSIVSDQFAGKSKIEQHRMVYSALNGVDIHALQIQTYVGNQNEQ